MNEVLQAISTVGYPISSCLLLMWYVWKQGNTQREERQSERDAHQKEMEAITAAINANTLVLESLKERLGGK